MNKIVKKISLCIIYYACHTNYSLADQFHNQNFLIGDRAIGLGGAYGGVADDASGVYYNPAGIAFALSNDISGSANAMYSKKTRFKKTVGTKDFTEESGGTVPSFFGGLLKIDNIAKDLVLAWGIYSLDSELKDQYDTFNNEVIGANSPCAEGGGTPPNNVLERFFRSVTSRAGTEYVGAALGWRATNKISLGFGLNYVKVDELVQEYQDVRQAQHYCKTDGGFEPGTLTLTQNVRQRLVAYGIQPVLGLQMSLSDRMTAGLTFKIGNYISQDFQQVGHIRKVKLRDSDQDEIEDDLNDPFPILQDVSIANIYQNSGDVQRLNNPLGRIPWSLRAGTAFFASTRLLLTADIVHTAAVTDAAQIGGFDYALYGKNAVTNFMAGMEYYLVPAIPIRLGIFTNNDARPKIDKEMLNQRDHVDYMGGSIFLAWVQPNSQIGAGVVLQSGKGEAQKIGGSKEVQDVEGQSFTFAFSATTTL